METTLELIIDKIRTRNPRHAKKIAGNITGLDHEFQTRANRFYDQYLDFVSSVGKSLDYGVESYLRMISDYIYEQVRFAESGEYSCKSFADANERVYNNPEVMDYYMHGLMLSQFLWKHHYDVFDFFVSYLDELTRNVSSYLEIGGGHGIYLAEAMDILGEKARYDLVDISPSSIEISRGFLVGRPVNYYLSDIYDFDSTGKYDFITMGEVLEHVEDPLSLLKRLNSMLSEEGMAFITAPANAPAIDHIYLFRNAADIRDMIDQAGMEVVEEVSFFAEDVTPEEAERLKVALMYAAFIRKKTNA